VMTLVHPSQLPSVGQTKNGLANRSGDEYDDVNLAAIGFRRWTPAPLPGSASRRIVVINRLSFTRYRFSITRCLAIQVLDTLHKMI